MIDIECFSVIAMYTTDIIVFNRIYRTLRLNQSKVYVFVLKRKSISALYYKIGQKHCREDSVS